MMHPDCRCPMCRRFPRAMKKISEMDSRPMSAESRQLLQAVVDEAYAKMAERIPVNGNGDPHG